MAISSAFEIGRGANTGLVRVLRKVRLRQAVARTAGEFCRSTTLHGFRDLPDGRVHWMDRFLLAVCLLVFIVWSIDLILLAWAAYVSNPIYVALGSTDYPVTNVPFPGVAICPNNKLSKTATRNYAEELASRTRGTVSADVFMEQLRFLGRLLDFEVDGYDSFIWLQNLLNNYDTDSLWYDVYGRMKRLSPQCHDMFLRCKWDGEERNCSELFELRATQYGFCCTFNYVRSDSAFDYHRGTEAAKSRFYGVDNGLHMVLNVSSDDDFYPLLSQFGYSALIFHAKDYPDQTTGYVEQRFIKPNVETLFEIYPETLDAKESVRFFTPQQRNCFFADEIPEYHGAYSHSECLLNCRVRSFVALCDCVPFFIPRSTRSSFLGNNTQTCNLEHVACLNKYLVKLRTYNPTNGNITGLEKEVQDSITCEECLPLCQDVKYVVGAMSIQMHPQADPVAWRRNMRREAGLVANDTDEEERKLLSPIAVVKIYYAQRISLLYVQDVVSEWFNMMSSYGGQAGVCIGFSLLSIVELAYFCTWRLWREAQSSYHEQKRKGKPTRRIKPFQRTQVDVRPVYNAHTDRYFLR